MFPLHTFLHSSLRNFFLFRGGHDSAEHILIINIQQKFLIIFTNSADLDAFSLLLSLNILYCKQKDTNLTKVLFLFPIKPEKNLVNKLVATAELFRISYSLPPIKFTCLLVSPLMYCKQIPKHVQLSISIFILVSQIWYHKCSVWRAVVFIVGVKGNLYDVRVVIYLSLCLC